jgi:hypothetical protein
LNGKLLSSKEVQFNIINKNFYIHLISPGNPIETNPQTIYTSRPVFRWFANAINFNIKVYKLKHGQTNPQEIINNRPIFEVNNISKFEYIYPNYGQLLEDGEIYAWQVETENSSSHGKYNNKSELFWFSLKETKVIRYNKIVVKPDIYNLEFGDTLELKLFGYDNDNIYKELTTVEWKIVPSHFGSIDSDGKFIAGKKEGTFAIVGTHNYQKAYSTIFLKTKK